MVKSEFYYLRSLEDLKQLRKFKLGLLDFKPDFFPILILINQKLEKKQWRIFKIVYTGVDSKEEINFKNLGGVINYLLKANNKQLFEEIIKSYENWKIK